MQKLVWTNSNGDTIDLTSGNYGITEWNGFSNTSLNIQSQQVPFQDGGVFLDALLDQRELSVTLAMRDNNDLELRYQQRRELIHILNPKLGEGYLVYTNDFTSKRIKCVPQIPLFETHNSDTSGTPKASLAWTACEPYWEDLENVTVNLLNNTYVNVENNGDVKIGLQVNINGDSDYVRLQNITTKQEIIVNDINGNLKINTTSGNKTVKLYKKAVEYKSGGTWNAGISIYGELFAVGSSILKITLEGTKEITNIDYTLGDIEVSANNKDYIVAGGDNCNILYTHNRGKTWNHTTISEDSHINLVFFKNNKFYVQLANSKYYESSDGSAWTLTTNPTVNKDKNIVFDGEKWVRISSNEESTVIQKSYDKSNWTTVTTLTNIINAQQIIFNTGKYYIFGYYDCIAESQNLTTWDFISGGLTIDNITSSYKYNNIIYFTSLTGGAFYTNDNFNTIHALDINPTESNTYIGIIRNGDIIIVLIGNGGYYYLSQNGGTSFTKQNFPAFISYLSEYAKIYYINNKFIILTGNFLLFSENGTTWTDAGLEYPSGVSPANLSLSDFIIKDDVFYLCQESCNAIWKLSEITYGDYNTLELVYPASASSITTTYGWYTIESDGENIVAGGKSHILRIDSHNLETMTILEDMGGYEQKIKKIVFENNIYKLSGFPGLYYESNDARTFKKFDSKVIYADFVTFETGEREWLLGSLNASFVIAYTDTTDEENYISKLTPDSRMDLVLNVGNNKIYFYTDGEVSANITFKKKYIGV